MKPVTTGPRFGLASAGDADQRDPAACSHGKHGLLHGISEAHFDHEVRADFFANCEFALPRNVAIGWPSTGRDVDQTMQKPPLTLITCPVIQPALSEARSVTRGATSSDSPMRRIE